jgi:secernin
VNEYGVAIGNHTVFSNEPIETKPGLIGMDLVRLGLERGRDAREALEVIATLIETHGQGGAALAPGATGYHNSFLLADPGEAWILETSNRRWAARRALLDSVSNHHSLGLDWEISSRDLESFARAEGWWRGSGRINVAAAYRHPLIPPQVSEGRQRRSLELLQQRRGRHDRLSFERLLRDHLEGGTTWHGEGGPNDERFFTLCAHSEPVHWTTTSLVAPLPNDRSGPWPVWVSFATPCTGIFLPVYLDGTLPPALARESEEPDPQSAWWTFKLLQDAAARDWKRYTPLLREAWDDFSEKLEVERAGVEAAARSAAVAGDRDTAAVIVSDFMARTVEKTLTQAEQLRARIAA